MLLARCGDVFVEDLYVFSLRFKAKQNLKRCGGVLKQKATSVKNGLIFNPQISREFRFIQFDCTVRNISNRICKTKTASKLEKKKF